jgi:hypothetical protein
MFHALLSDNHISMVPLVYCIDCIDILKWSMYFIQSLFMSDIRRN